MKALAGFSAAYHDINQDWDEVIEERGGVTKVIRKRKTVLIEQASAEAALIFMDEINNSVQR